MSLKNVCMAQYLRAQGLRQRKRVLLEQIWLPGRLMEGLFSTSGSWCFMAQFDFHSWGVKVGAAPRLSKGVLLFNEGLPCFQRVCLGLVDIAAPPYVVSYSSVFISNLCFSSQTVLDCLESPFVLPFPLLLEITYFSSLKF